MVRYIAASFLVISITSFLFISESEQTPLDVIKTEGGLVSGELSNGVHSYKGVPYAAPPIKDLRWKEPQPVKPWTGTLACTAFPPSPIQNDPKPFLMWSQEFITPATPLSEDCLYLNIWTSAKTANDKLPVLVWIHGGAFISGSGACPIYDGEAIAKEGIVYISINYRLGVLGFMAHPELTAESARKSSGNYGLMDQIAALKWIRKNIAAFGGDPDRMTIAGQSAGSMSVQALVASPLTKGLFKGAIAQSGGMTNRPSRTLAEAEKDGLALSGKLKSKTIQALRNLPADSLLALGNTLPFGSYSPIADGYVIPQDARTIFEKKQHNDVALMAGWVTGDGALVMGPGQSADKFRSSADKYGTRKDEFLKLFPAESDQASKESQQKLAILQFAALPDRQWAASNKNASYIYQFSYVPTDKPGFPSYGAFHTSEVPFALHTLSKWNRPWENRDLAVEKYMTAYWVNFVKTGNPNGNNLPDWKPYTSTEGNIMEFGEQPVLNKGLFSREFKFLESVKN